jgi:hypothetical protein
MKKAGFLMASLLVSFILTQCSESYAYKATSSDSNDMEITYKTQCGSYSDTAQIAWNHAFTVYGMNKGFDASIKVTKSTGAPFSVFICYDWGLVIASQTDVVPPATVDLAHWLSVFVFP